MPTRTYLEESQRLGHGLDESWDCAVDAARLGQSWDAASGVGELLAPPSLPGSGSDDAGDAGGWDDVDADGPVTRRRGARRRVLLSPHEHAAHQYPSQQLYPRSSAYANRRVQSQRSAVADQEPPFSIAGDAWRHKLRTPFVRSRAARSADASCDGASSVAHGRGANGRSTMPLHFCLGASPNVYTSRVAILSSSPSFFG